eukprot:GHVU01209453.1.p1 GENE.GHVU01209453.1~~GHVU01209453.1.p1  ORF type:complete len:143 (+),score=7.75 GHVU01209453.1:183-611(+)
MQTHDVERVCKCMCSSVHGVVVYHRFSYKLNLFVHHRFPYKLVLHICVEDCHLTGNPAWQRSSGFSTCRAPITAIVDASQPKTDQQTEQQHTDNDKVEQKVTSDPARSHATTEQIRNKRKRTVERKKMYERWAKEMTEKHLT